MVLYGNTICPTQLYSPLIIYMRVSSEGVTATMDFPITLQVNGAIHQLTIDTRTTLQYALREHLGFTGPKKGCNHG
jgi:xanthine dehydrogenase YagT iron-sulfur-binding subunit